MTFCAALCTLGLMTSCNHEVTPESIAGKYNGTMDIKFNLPGTSLDEVEVPNHVVVSRLSDSNVEVAIDLDLAKYLDPSWAALAGSNLNFGAVTANCLVGPTIDGEAPLTGTAQIGDATIPVTGECEGRTLDLTIPIGIVTIEFEGIRQ